MDEITIENAARAFYIHVWKDHGLRKFIISNRGTIIRDPFLGTINYEVKDISKFFHILPFRNSWSNGNNEFGFRIIFQSIYELFPERLGFLVTINRICYK